MIYIVDVHIFIYLMGSNMFIQLRTHLWVLFFVFILNS